MKYVFYSVLLLLCAGCHFTSNRINSYDEKMIATLHRYSEGYCNETDPDYFDSSLVIFSILRIADSLWYIDGSRSYNPHESIASGISCNGLDSYYFPTHCYVEPVEEKEIPFKMAQKIPIRDVITKLSELYTQFDLDETYHIHAIYYPFHYSWDPADSEIIRIELENKSCQKKFIYSDGKFSIGDYVNYYDTPWDDFQIYQELNKIEKNPEVIKNHAIFAAPFWSYVGDDIKTEDECHEDEKSILENDLDQ